MTLTQTARPDDAQSHSLWGDRQPVCHRMFLLGNGVGESKTPRVHEAEGKAQGMWISYGILDSHDWGITAADLPDVVAWAKREGFSGFNVTHPFKQDIIPHLDGLSDRAAALGAVNTVVLHGGRAIGHNTDWCGFQTPFTDAMPTAGRGTVVQMGAGGAGAAVAYAMLDLGTSHLEIFDLDPAKAALLVDRMSQLYDGDRVTVGTDLPTALAGAEGVINTTPMGMARHPGSAVPVELLRPDLWVSEIVYFPRNTELLVQARRVGCRTVDGAGMAAEQAVRSFELFTGTTADAARMHSLVRTLAV
jgi:shikimate dehydrogenase